MSCQQTSADTCVVGEISAMKEHLLREREGRRRGREGEKIKVSIYNIDAYYMCIPPIVATKTHTHTHIHTTTTHQSDHVSVHTQLDTHIPANAEGEGEKRGEGEKEREWERG